MPRRRIRNLLTAIGAAAFATVVAVSGAAPSTAAPPPPPTATGTLFVTEMGTGGFAGTVLSYPVIDGATVPVPTTVASGIDGPYSIAVEGNTVYIAEYYAGRVLSVPVTGGVPRTVASGLDRPYGIDVSDGILYVTLDRYVTTDGRTLVSIPASGGTVTTLTTGLNRPEGVAVTGDTVYVANYGAGNILAIPRTGGPGRVVATITGPRDLTVDGDTIYFTTVSPYQLWSVPVTGGTPGAVTGDVGFAPYGIDSVGNDLFFSKYSTGEVLSVPKAGGALRTEVNGLVNPSGIEFEPGTTCGSVCLPGTGSIGTGSLGS